MQKFSNKLLEFNVINVSILILKFLTNHIVDTFLCDIQKNSHSLLLFSKALKEFKQQNFNTEQNIPH